MKKLNKLFAILFAVLGVSALSAQEWTDKTSLLANPSFENETTATNLGSGKNGWGGPTGWILSPSTAPANSQSGAIASSCNIQGIATTFPTADGGNYFYVRTNWNNDPTFALSQVISGDLPAGLYRLTCMAASNSGNWSTSTFKLTLKEGDGNISTNSSLNKCSEWTEWTVDLYKTDPSTSLTIEAAMRAGSSGGGQHYQMLLDDFKLEYMSFDDIEAAGWPKPQVPGSNLKSFVGTSVVAALYNVGSDAFITRGMTWGTQAIATKLHNSDSQTQATSDRHHVKVSAGDGDLVRFAVNGKNYLGDGGQGTTTTVYTDNGNTNTNQFIYSQLNEGTYKLKVKNATSDVDAFLDVSQPYGGQLTYANGQGFTEWAIIKFSDIENGKYASYKAKKAMYEVYKAVVDAGHSATYSDALRTALGTYIKPNATASDVTAATNVLIKAVAPALTAGYVNAGALFTNPDIRGAGNKSDWTSGYTNISWGCFENYHTNHGDRKLTQTKEVPNGFYKVVFHGIWRQDGGDAAPTLTLTSNGKSQSANVPCMTDIDFGVGNTNGSNNWTTKAGKIVPNGMQSAGEALSHRDAQVTISDFVVSDGQLTIEMNSSSTSQWILAQGFDIYYKAESLDEYASLFDAAKAAAEAIDQNTLNTYAKDQLSIALNNAATEQIDKEWYQERTKELNDAVALANSISAPYVSLASLVTICEEICANSIEAVKGVKSTFEAALNSNKDKISSAQTADAINTIFNELDAARKDYIEKADPVDNYYFDYTYKIQNPSFETGDTNGWSVSNGGDTGAKLNSNGTYTINGADGEFVYNTWGADPMFVSQVVKALPTGRYKVKAILAADEGTVIDLTAGETTVKVTTTDKATATEGEVETSYSSGDFLIKATSANWFKADHFRLYYYGFDVEAAQSGVTTLKAKAEALVGKPMNKDVATTLNNAIAGADASKTTRLELNPMIEVLNKAIADAEASVTDYAAIKTYIDKADKIDASIATDYTDYKSQYDNGSIAETATKVFQALEVATYKYVTENFNYAVSLSSTWNSTGTNTSAKEFNNEHWSGETRGYMNQNDDNGQGWNANAWSLDFDQDVTLPAGEYVFKVAGRKSADATLELVVTMGETILGTVSDFPNGSVGLGINKAGEASFDPNDQFARGDNTGCGWQWRYVKFTLDNEATVKIAVHAETNVLHNWVSFGDYTLQMTEETYLAANMHGLVAPTTAAEALVDTKPMGTAENEALQAALDMPVTTGAELLAKIDALKTAVANANAWVTAYNAAKAPLVAALERFEADYNNGANGCLYHLQKAAWSTVIEKVQAAAEAKDVTYSYAGFQTEADNLNAALDAAQTSINMYANFAAEISYAKAYTPIVTENVAAHNTAITAAENAYNAAEIDDASELIRAMQNFRVIDYEYVSNYYNLDQPVELNGEWTGDKNTTNGQHWKGDNTSYYDYNQSNEEPYEATITVTLQPGEYVLMAAGRAQTTGSSAYIKVTDKLAYFAAKGNTGYGIDTDGKANFSSEATYANDNKGRGWEYRFIEFTLTEETEVTLVAGMQIGSNSWASVCTPVLYTTPLNAAKNDLQTAIDEAEKALNAYPVGEEAFQVSENSELYVALKSAIATAQNVLDNAATAEELNNAIDPLNTAVSNYNDGYVLNAPKEGVKYQIAISYAGYRYDGSAFAPNADPTKGIAVPVKNNSSNVNYWNDFTFTPVNDIRNGYTISITSVDGTTYYLCTGKQENGSNENQIRMTTNPEKALTLVVKATATDGIYNLLNTRANNATIGCQDDNAKDGGLYTTNAHNTITITEAVKAKVTLKISSVGWATLILPFNAELPEGVVAYESGEVVDDAVQLVSAESLVANTPYLIKGTEGTYNFSGYGLATEDSYTKNLFVGTYVEIDAEVGSYVLQNPKDDEGNPRGLGFYLVGEGQPTVKAYRSYMKYTPAEGQAASPMFRIGGSTGIDNATLPSSEEIVIYDLMGRKVTTMEKGNMYIINGRKVIVK